MGDADLGERAKTLTSTTPAALSALLYSLDNIVLIEVHNVHEGGYDAA